MLKISVLKISESNFALVLVESAIVLEERVKCDSILLRCRFTELLGLHHGACISQSNEPWVKLHERLVLRRAKRGLGDAEAFLRLETGDHCLEPTLCEMILFKGLLGKRVDCIPVVDVL